MIKKLPDELIIATLTSLSAKSIISFCSTNHYYHELYNATNILQYIGELGKAGCEDLGCKVISPFYIPSEEFSSSRERRSYLEARETFWRSLDLRRLKVVRVRLKHNFFRSKVFGLSASNLVLKSKENGGLRCIDLKETLSHSKTVPYPSDTPTRDTTVLPETEPHWRHLPVKGTIVNVGLALEEHDLIAVVTTAPKRGSRPK